LGVVGCCISLHIYERDSYSLGVCGGNTRGRKRRRRWRRRSRRRRRRRRRERAPSWINK
jgi:hypothetical protein